MFVSSATWDDPTKVSGREATTTGGRGERSKKIDAAWSHPFHVSRGGILPSFAHTKDGEDKGKPPKIMKLRNFNMRSGMEFPKTKLRMHMA